MGELCSDEVNKLRVGLREYVDVRLSALEKQLETATVVLDARLGSMNEFRATISDQASTFITRQELALWREKLEADISMLREFKTTIDAKADQRSLTAIWIVQAISIFIAVISFLLMLLEKT